MLLSHVLKQARRVFFALALFLCFAVPVAAGDFQIVPGQRIGSIALGMSRQSVEILLHAPRFSRRISHGVVEESWVTMLSRTERQKYSSDGCFWKYAFVNMYFQQDCVEQVEVNSPLFHTRGGLSVKSSASAFEKRFPHWLSVAADEYYDKLRELAGWAPKHVVAVEDAARQGIAWRYGAWGAGAPESDPAQLEVIIVHRRGRPVILEPDGGNRFVQTQDAIATQ